MKLPKGDTISTSLIFRGMCSYYYDFLYFSEAYNET